MKPSTTTQKPTPKSSPFDPAAILEKLRRLQLLSEPEIKTLCHKARELLIEEPNLKQLNCPLIIAGDTHGQYFDLLELFRVGGDIRSHTYLFLGDYVDRGLHSVESFSLLLALKVIYPRNITLLRGNHESRHLTVTYSFYDEVLQKYGSSSVWKMFTDIFDHLPLAAVIEEEIFCVHGGICERMTLNDIRVLDRAKEVELDATMVNMLWNDPREGFG